MTGHSGLDDSRQINRALSQLRVVTGLPLTFGGPVNAARQVRLTEFAGANKGAMRGLSLDFGLGLGGKVVALRRPMVVNDYVGSDGISHHYDQFIKAEALRAMVAVPVVVQRNVRAVLYGAVRSAIPLGDRIIQSIMDAARDLEQTLAGQAELNRRLDRLEEYTAAARMNETASPEWEVVRQTYAELRILLQEMENSALRQRMGTICEKLAAVCAPQSPRERVPLLSPRELDVLSCIALGSTNPAIARDLGLRPETVKSYLRSAMRKLGAHTRLEAVVAARRAGLLP